MADSIILATARAYSGRFGHRMLIFRTLRVCSMLKSGHSKGAWHTHTKTN